MNTNPGVELKPAKAIVAGIGATATAVLAWVSAVAVYASDDKIDLSEVAPIVGATISLCGTIYGVWKITNRPKDGSNSLT